MKVHKKSSECSQRGFIDSAWISPCLETKHGEPENDTKRSNRESIFITKWSPMAISARKGAGGIHGTQIDTLIIAMYKIHCTK